MSKARKPGLTEWQRLARAGLRVTAAAYPDNLAIVSEHGRGDLGADWTTIRLRTGDLPTGENGLAVNAFEEVIVGWARHHWFRRWWS